MKKLVCALLAFVLFIMIQTTSFAKIEPKGGAEWIDDETVATPQLELTAKSVCLIESSTGTVLYSENEKESLPLASVTKIMTLLLVCESLESGSIKLTDKVRISQNAASMGGSQVFLEEGEEMTVEELIKCAVIASANDAALALAEHTFGSESEAVRRMNERAVQLGMKNSRFENTTGLDDTVENHYSSALDIAIMSKELIKHNIILKYSGIWQDTIRDGSFTLTNTNRLVRYYDGCNGLKTGSTDKAGYCVSASAKRGNMQLIAVVMGSPSRDDRNTDARKLLDFGFSSFALFERGEEYLEDCKVLSGVLDKVPLYSGPVSFLTDRSKLSKIETVYEIPESIKAPIKKGDKVGKIIYKSDNKTVGESNIYAGEDVDNIGFVELLLRIIKKIFIG